MLNPSASFDPSDSRDRYPCPLCRIGQLSTMPFMETWGCGFCGQLFEDDQATRSLRLVDQSMPQAWNWDGRQWQRQPLTALEPIWLWQGLSVLLVVLPPAIVGISAYLFPPEPDAFLHELPFVWTGLTLLAHLFLVLYLITEYYQVPFIAYWQALPRFWSQRQH
jgi:hypothetical protein